MGGSKENLRPIQNHTGPKEDWARNPTPGKVETAELEGQLSSETLIRRTLTRAQYL